MVEKTLKEKLGYDYNLLAQAQVAGEYLKQGGREGVGFAGKSIETILDDMGVKDPSIRNVLADPQVLSKTIKSQLETYDRCRKGETIGELISYHSKTLDSYVANGGVARVKADLAGFMGETYESVQKKIAKLNDVIAGKEFGRSSDKQVEEAEKSLEVLGKVISTIEMSRDKKLSDFRVRVEDGMNRDNYGILYPEIKKPAVD